MKRTQNSETTQIAYALQKVGMRFTVENITEETYFMLRKKREAALLYKNAFLREELTDWYEMIVQQTDCATESLESFRQKNARYIYIAERK